MEPREEAVRPLLLVQILEMKMQTTKKERLCSCCLHKRNFTYFKKDFRWFRRTICDECYKQAKSLQDNDGSQGKKNLSQVPQVQ
jgi:superfamily II helicase